MKIYLHYREIHVISGRFLAPLGMTHLVWGQKGRSGVSQVIDSIKISVNYAKHHFFPLNHLNFMSFRAERGISSGYDYTFGKDDSFRISSQSATNFRDVNKD